MVEFYHESKCIVYAKLGLIRQLCEDKCECSESDPDLLDVKVVHHEHGHGHVYIEPNVLEQVDEMTQVDPAVYIVALRRFMCDVRLVEEWLGLTITCNRKLHDVQADLQYLEVNVTTLHWHACN